LTWPNNIIIWHEDLYIIGIMPSKFHLDYLKTVGGV